jgi:hypothetical protein
MSKKRTELSTQIKSRRLLAVIVSLLAIIVLFIPAIYVRAISLNVEEGVLPDIEFDAGSLVAYAADHSSDIAGLVGESELVRLEFRYICNFANCELDNVIVFTEISPIIAFWPFGMSSKYNSYGLDSQSGTYTVLTWPHNREPNPSQLCLNQNSVDNHLDTLINGIISESEDTANQTSEEYIVMLIWDGYFQSENCYWSIQTGNDAPDYEVLFSDL